MWILILGASLAVSLITFCAYGWDKRRATKHHRRVPERTLHLLALCGGWPGGSSCFGTSGANLNLWPFSGGPPL